ncbi:uncharacterized protein LOC108699375 isoform X2 [Xenopus laevis]|uniref:Uncharacterized protein LOC108699375 isoform X2 n=1 Tax=Xenopus laevis TaxID=8355 RepID=A0A8J1LIQ5_XENLA|nr:uncharacterized protein LOC108699375 isoform X2 [Xenopus laevis]
MQCTMHPLIRLLFILFISFTLLGTEDPVAEVNKPVNGTVTFHHGFELGNKINCTIRVTSQGVLKEVAEYRKSRFNVTNEQFVTRTVFNNLTLEIQKLTLNDSGVYEISCKNPAKKSIRFKLMVYKPVHQPVINSHCQCGSNGCNCSLHCLDPTNTTSAHWIILKDSEHANILNKSTIWTLLADTSENTEYMCVLQNPADQKNTSIGFWKLCSASGYSHIRCRCLSNWEKCIYFSASAGVLVFILILAIAKKIKDTIQSKKQTNNEMEMTSVKSQLMDKKICGTPGHLMSKTFEASESLQ